MFLWIIGSSITGLTYVKDIENSYNTFFCWGINAVHGIIYGGG